MFIPHASTSSRASKDSYQLELLNSSKRDFFLFEGGMDPRLPLERIFEKDYLERCYIDIVMVMESSFHEQWFLLLAMGGKMEEYWIHGKILDFNRVFKVLF